jgi:oligoendopeptidase F
VKDWNYEAKLRGYDSAISMRNSANHVSDQAISTLMQVCEKNSDIFQQFFIYKAKMLGVEKLRRFDIYAPIGELKTTLSYESALELVLESFDDFSADFASKAREIIASNHVDALPSANKRSGAFCATIAPSTKPYVLLNYSGKGSDVSTLAHELGHGVHSIYAQEHSISSQHPSLPLAETASTFAEMVLFEKLLAKTTDRDEKKLMLADKIASSYASILRQNFFVKFEIEAHQKIQEGITEQELSALWMKTLQDQFGESVEVDEMFRHEWAYIPHIHHTPFYCYAYNFGELLSMALYQRYKNEGDSFIAVIEKILSAGGSQDPAVVLQEAGIDMASAEFWQGSFTIIEGWISQLEAL